MSLKIVVYVCMPNVESCVQAFSRTAEVCFD